MQDYSYLGSGKLYIREYGANAALAEIGNCSALSFSPQTESKELKDFTTPGGGLRNSVERNVGVDVAYTFHDFSPTNFARALRGSSASSNSGTVAAEDAVAYAGGFIKTAKIPSGTIVVKDKATGATTYTAGTDYEVRTGGIYILDTTTIPAPVAGAVNITIGYAYNAQDTVQAMINSAKQYELVFAGLNEARSGKATVVKAHKVSHGVIQAMALLGEDYGAGEVSGKVLQDTTITGAGLSQYFTVQMEQ